MRRTFTLGACVLCATLVFGAAPIAQAPAGARGAVQRGLTADTERQLRQSLQKAEAYLRSQQKPDESTQANVAACIGRTRGRSCRTRS